MAHDGADRRRLNGRGGSEPRREFHAECDIEVAAAGYALQEAAVSFRDGNFVAGLAAVLGARAIEQRRGSARSAHTSGHDGRADLRAGRSALAGLVIGAPLAHGSDSDDPRSGQLDSELAQYGDHAVMARSLRGWSRNPTIRDGRVGGVARIRVPASVSWTNQGASDVGSEAALPDRTTAGLRRIPGRASHEKRRMPEACDPAAAAGGRRPTPATPDVVTVRRLDAHPAQHSARGAAKVPILPSGTRTVARVSAQLHDTRTS